MKPLLCILLLASGLHAQGERMENTVILNASGIANLGIETTAIEESTFERVIPVLGGIEHTCESHAVLSSRIAGRAVDVLAHQGEFVEKDQLVGRIESRQPGDPPPVVDLKSPASGLIVKSDLHLGGPVEPDKELMEILDLSNVWAIARVPQHHAAILKEGLEAKIRIPALGTDTLTAKFLRLHTENDAVKGVVEAIFELPNPGNKIRPGMQAEISLVAAKREGVVTIPRSALQGESSNRFVFVKDFEIENAFVKASVTIGEISGDQVEILKGLLPGDEIVTTGAYALSFAGKGSVSLREALDAAHGHPHNEDGTEMSDEQAAAGHGHDHGGHDDHEDGVSPLTLFLAIACGVLFLLLVASPFFFRARSNA